jgi:DNA polymerase elongation subunit (family B)
MYVPKTISIIFLRDEKELGEYFRSYLRMRQPDVLVAWNGWDFDFNILEEKYSRIFTGFGLFDMMFGYSMFHHAKYGELESKALDYCAKSVVGHGKVGLTGHRPYDTYKTAMPWFAFYNLSDALLMFEMERKVHVVNHYMYLATLTGVDIKDVPRETKIVESTIFQMLRGTKLVLPSKSEHRVAKEKVGGGKVENPATGLMEYVIYIDLKGEYPSIMRTFNLSPEMVVQEKEVPNVPVYTLPPRDLKIKSKPKGLVPQILTTFATERDLMKKEMKKHLPETPEYDAIFERQEAFKFLMNSFTGVMGNAGFRLYNPGIIDTVTGTGRAHIAWIKDIVENKIGLKVLYADTDSNFILSGKTTLDEAVKVGQDMVKQLNASFDDFVKQYGCTEHVFSISLKKVFGKWFQAGAKKRWTGRVIWEDGVNLIEKKADYDETKGYETRRSSSPDYTRWIQKEMFNLLFTKGTDAIVEFLTEQYKILAGGKIKVEDLGIPIGLNQEEYEKSKPIHVRAAEYSRKYLGKEIHTGDKIKYYYVKNIKGCPETNVFALLREESVPLDLVTIDLDEHIRRCFTQPLEPILEGLGLDIKKIMGIKEVKVRTLMEFE